jgi:hypothetical protein
MVIKRKPAREPLARVHVSAAARLLGYTREHVGRLIRQGVLTVIRRDTRRTWLAVGEVEAFRDQGPEGAEFFRASHRDHYPRKGARLK